MEKVQIDKDALTFVAERPGPYTHANGDGGYWHKENHTGNDTCAGCAVEAALNTAP
jgi:hypothetical protein